MITFTISRYCMCYIYKKVSMLKTFLFILVIFGINFGFTQNSEVLADSYYKKGEFKKALIIYQNLNKEKPYSYKDLLDHL